MWLDDFEEATTDYGWIDDMRARWFSWFVSGPAKATWQRTLITEQKKDWKSIVKVYQGQYGVECMLTPALLTKDVMNSGMTSLNLHKDC